MTALATYDDLVTEAQDWLFGRSDIAAKVPTFVRMAEAKFNRKLMVRQMEQRAKATIDLTADEPEFITLPGDFQAMRRVRLLDGVNGKTRLKFAAGAQIDDLRERDGDTPGEPIWFSIFSDQLELCPTPVSAYTVEMVYRRDVPPLGDGDGFNATNWLFLLAPDLYLYSTLMEAAPYLHEDERIPVWSSGVQTAIEDLTKLSEEALFNAGPLTARRRGRSY